MIFHIITLFPESFESYLSSSIIGRAVCNRKIKIKFYNPREFTPDKWKRVDHKPYAGGPGMVIEAEAVIKATEKALTPQNSLKLRREKERKSLIIWLSPSGKQFDNSYAEKISKKFKDVVIICGRYEGIDERAYKVIKKWKGMKTEKLTAGPYVLTGGELPAMIILDAVSRRIPGVLGKLESVEENRVSSAEVYTRPEVLKYPFGKIRVGKGKKYRVPKVLLSGNHKKIEEWRNKH